MIIIKKKAKINGGWVNDCWMFTKSPNNEPYAEHYYNNDRGTYYRSISRVFFKNDEQGNEKYKKLIADGYTK